MEVDDVVLILVEKGWGIDDLLLLIVNIWENEDVYIVGIMNVGKFILINKLIEVSVGEKDVVIILRFFGIILDMIDIFLDEILFMYDILGII